LTTSPAHRFGTAPSRPSADALGGLGAARRDGLFSWMLTTDHKRIAVMTFVTALLGLLGFGALALAMRAQLAVPSNHVLSAHTYDEFFTIHGSGMIYLVITPLAVALGVYLVPLQVGAANIAAPRANLFAYYLYLFGALAFISGFATASGAADDGWSAYTPLSTSQYSPGYGVDVWIVGTFLSAVAMLIMSGSVLVTVARLRTPQMSLMKMPLMTWSSVVTALLGVASFPMLMAAMVMLGLGRFDATVTLFHHNVWNIGYQEVFWFYGHPVVYIMFFPFVGCVIEVVACFGQRRSVGYKGTVIALLLFATGSMAVWGHHMFTTGQVDNYYYSATSEFLVVPAGLEYFGFLATLIGSKLRYDPPMLFALAFIPQFLIGGMSGVLLGMPTNDYMFHDSYFLIGHFHYTLFAGSFFGFMAGFYFWFPKVTGRMLRRGLGIANFWLLVVGTNTTFLPFFALGMLGMPRRVSSYPASAGFEPWTLISSIGAGILAVAMTVFVFNVVLSVVRPVAAGSNPWNAFTLEWATSSPPPVFNFDAPLPPITSFAPLLDARERQVGAGEQEAAGERLAPGGSSAGSGM
jgi:cytochrome c oxidase subunit 1